ncbi:MAG: hypothetical protein ABIG20_01415 [archaeon]
MGRKLSNEEYSKLKRNILKKLYANEAFRKGHLLFERLQHGIPPHLSGFVKGVLSGLLNEGLVVPYGKTKYGDAYQLNIQKLREIEEYLNYHN